MCLYFNPFVSHVVLFFLYDDAKNPGILIILSASLTGDFKMYSSSLMYIDTHNYSSLQDCYDDIPTCKTNKQTMSVRTTIISSLQGYYLVNLFLVFSSLFGKSYMKRAKTHINIWHQLVRTTLLLPLLLLSSFLSTCVLNCKINLVWNRENKRHYKSLHSYSL